MVGTNIFFYLLWLEIVWSCLFFWKTQRIFWAPKKNHWSLCLFFILLISWSPVVVWVGRRSPLFCTLSSSVFYFFLLWLKIWFSIWCCSWAVNMDCGAPKSLHQLPLTSLGLSPIGKTPFLLWRVKSEKL